MTTFSETRFKVRFQYGLGRSSPAHSGRNSVETVIFFVWKFALHFKNVTQLSKLIYI